jgi:hypothetical protein
MLTILASACISQDIIRHPGRADCVPIGKPAGTGGSKKPRNWSITRRSKSSRTASDSDPPAGCAMTAFDKLLIAVSESRKSRRNSVRYPGKRELKKPLKTPVRPWSSNEVEGGPLPCEDEVVHAAGVTLGAAVSFSAEFDSSSSGIRASVS